MQINERIKLNDRIKLNERIKIIERIKIKRKIKIIKQVERALMGIVLCGISLWLAGCTDETAQEPESIYHTYMAGSMEEAPAVEYLVPQSLPNILTDRRGYSVSDVKKAFITGRELPETFTLVNGRSGETVFYGPIKEKTYDAGLARYVGYVDFSQVDEPGSYYVKCDVVGQSYRFDIKEQLYPELFQEAYGEVVKACGSGSLSVLEAMRLLEAYEWYGELFPDQNRNKVPDVLEKLQGWVAYMEENGAGAGEEALYAAFLAKLSYNYKNHDYQYATECLKRAATVFGQAPGAAAGDADSFYALTELFRATGLNTYHSRILEYRDFFEKDKTYPEEESYLCGSMTYLVTRQRVDAELCEMFMYSIMSRGEEIAEQYWDMVAPSPSGSNTPASLMKYVSELSCANFIWNNYQYTNIIEEFLHCLMGRNLESVNFYENGGDRTGYLRLFAQLAAAYEDMMGVK